VGLCLYIFLILMAYFTLGMHEATGEVLPRYSTSEFSVSTLERESGSASTWQAWFRRTERRRQLLAFVITDQPEEVARGVIDQMKRGVTELSGKGMYTGKAHGILMCALTVTEVAHFKAIVSAVDAAAFVIVSPAQEILGKGFNPLKK
jgi:hypothetical protein